MTVSKLEKPDWRLFFDHLSKIPEIRKHPPETGPKTGLKTASTLSAVEPVPAAAMIALPWTAPSFAAVKGIIHEPSTKPTMKPESRDTLLTAVAKARGWIDDIRLGRIASFAGIAERESVGERHIRLLVPLAFLSPRIIAAIADGTAPADLTVTGLAKALPYSWAEQERAILRNT